MVLKNTNLTENENIWYVVTIIFYEIFVRKKEKITWMENNIYITCYNFQTDVWSRIVRKSEMLCDLVFKKQRTWSFVFFLCIALYFTAIAYWWE